MAAGALVHPRSGQKLHNEMAVLIVGGDIASRTSYYSMPTETILQQSSFQEKDAPEWKSSFVLRRLKSEKYSNFLHKLIRQSSTLYNLNIGIKSFQLYSSIIRFKLPVRLRLAIVSIRIPSRHFLPHFINTIYPTGKTLSF
jgi:hypothetical protein